MTEADMELVLQQASTATAAWDLVRCLLVGLVRKGILTAVDARQIVDDAIYQSDESRKNVVAQADPKSEYAARLFSLETEYLKEILQHSLLRQSEEENPSSRPFP